MIVVPNKKILNSLQNKKEGELARIEDPLSYFVVKDGEWVETSPAQISMTTYDINKQIYEKREALDDYALTCGEAVLAKYIKETDAEFYMLLNHEFRYFTLFETKHDDLIPAAREVLNVLAYFDDVKAIERVENGVEIWATYEGQIGMFLFFEYDKGVIKCQ